MSWDGFIAGFCEVQFLCFQGHPNWLGWIVLAVAGIIAFVALAIAWVVYEARTDAEAWHAARGDPRRW